MSEPLGRTVGPACMWITKAEQVVAAAHAVAGHVSADTRAAQLASELDRSESRSAGWRTLGIASAILAVTATVGFAGVWVKHGDTRAQYVQLLDVVGDIRVAAKEPVLPSSREPPRGPMTDS